MIIFYYLRLEAFPNLEGQVPVFISPRNRVTQLYPQALGSLFVAFYYTQGYGGATLTRLHTGWSTTELLVLVTYPRRGNQIVEREETTVAREQTINMFRLQRTHDATIEEPLEMVFSTGSARGYKTRS
jgi:hypothetical protein